MDKTRNLKAALVISTLLVGVVQAWVQQDKIIASDANGGDEFGTSVSIDGNYAIAGAMYADANGTDSGSTYIFYRDPTGGWTQQAKLIGSDTNDGDELGRSVSIDGDYAIVGAQGADAAYIFKRSGTSWSQEAKLVPSSPGGLHGYPVEINGDYAIVGACTDDPCGVTWAGSAYLYYRNEGGADNWGQQAKLIPSDPGFQALFGSGASISGDYAIVGAMWDDANGVHSGSAYIFYRNQGGNNNWGQQTKIIGSDTGGGDTFGVSASIDGDYAIIGAYDAGAGAAYVFKRNGASWNQQAKLTASDGNGGDRFGISVSIEENYVIIGAVSDDDNGTDSGSAYIFNRSGTTWSEIAKLTASDGNDGDYFGESVSISGAYAIVGAPDDDPNGTDSGSAYIYQYEGYLIVDNFDSYEVNLELRTVWNDYSFNGTQAEVRVYRDAQYARDGNSMEYEYWNDFSPYYSEATAAIADLPVGSDWTAGGVKALVMYFHGSIDNSPEPFYVALTDGNNRTATVLYDDPNDLAKPGVGFQEWNIDLQDFVAANSVDLNDVNTLTIGFGNSSNPQPGGTGIVYFDDIRLYPARYVPEYARTQGDFDGDSFVDFNDVDVLQRDWLISAIGNVTAAAPTDANLVGHWPLDDDVSAGPPDAKRRVVDTSGNANHALLHDPNNIPGESTGVHHTDDREEGTGALTFDGEDDHIEIPALNLNLNTVTISAWIKRDGEQAGTFTGIVFSRDASTVAGLGFGSGPGSHINNELAYKWNDDPSASAFHSGLIIPDNEWVFVAVAVEPTVASFYMEYWKLYCARNFIDHDIEQFDGPTLIGRDPGSIDRHFKGLIDDVRIYDYTLTPAELLYLAVQGPGSQYIELEDWRADANGDGTVNLIDYGVMADNWLQEVLWPEP